MLGLCLYPLSAINQMGVNDQNIYDLSYSGLNKKAQHASLKQAMCFERSLHCLLDRILDADLDLEMISMRKVNLVDAYVGIWVRPDKFLTVEFLVTKENDSDPQLVGFHLSILMSYLESAP